MSGAADRPNADQAEYWNSAPGRNWLAHEDMLDTVLAGAEARLIARADPRPGEWVLVHGAAGGVGLAAVDLAKVMGAKVIAAPASDRLTSLILGEEMV